MSGYEHDHEHGHFQPHTHPHRHLGEQPTEAHERSGMGAHHHQHTARPAVPEALDRRDEGPCPRCGVTVNHWTGYPDGWTCDPQEVAAYRLAALRSEERTE